MIEYLDILDENGNFTGEKKLRNLVHRDGDWHRTVHCWIINSENAILFQLRSPEKESHANQWDISCAGHVSAGETSLEAAKKELKEELGLNADAINFQFIVSIPTKVILNNGNFVNNSFNDVYIGKVDLNLDDLILQKEEVSAVKWVSIQELKRIIEVEPVEYVLHPEEFELLVNYLDKH